MVSVFALLVIFLGIGMFVKTSNALRLFLLVCAIVVMLLYVNFA